MKVDQDPYTCLTWDDLESWAGGRIVSRGRSYQRSGAVSELGILPDGGLVAWVAGSDIYATNVFVDRSVIGSNCTCPFGVDCKHGVAVLLEYLERSKRGESVPKCSDKDARIGMIENPHEEDLESDEGWFDDEFVEDESLDDEYINVPRALAKLSKPAAQKVLSFLSKKKKAELIDLFVDLSGQLPDLGRALRELTELGSGSHKSLLQAIERDIEDLQSEPSMYGSGDESETIARLTQRLTTLAGQGHSDLVAELAEEVLQAGINVVETVDHDGELSMAFESTMLVVYQALSKCSWPMSDKMGMAAALDLADEYSICDTGSGTFWDREFPKDAWSDFANGLSGQLDVLPRGTRSGWSRSYERDRLAGRLVRGAGERGAGGGDSYSVQGRG